MRGLAGRGLPDLPGSDDGIEGRAVCSVPKGRVAELLVNFDNDHMRKDCKSIGHLVCVGN